MHGFLRQSTASQTVLVGPFVSSTDGDTQRTGLTIANTDIKLSKAGGAKVSKNSGGATHDSAGDYALTLDATDTNTVGVLRLSVHVATALPVIATFQVLEEAVYDAVYAASATGKLPATLAAADVSGNLPADLQTIKTQTVTAAAGVTFPASIGTSTYAGTDTAGTTTLLSRVTAAVMLASSYSAPPSAATNASAVRTELATELARIDAAVSSRLASGSYSAPPSAAAIRAEIDSNSVALAAIYAAVLDVPTNAELATALAGADDATLAAVAATAAQLVKVLAVIYDDATVSGDTITLSNGATLTVTASGRTRAGG